MLGESGGDGVCGGFVVGVCKVFCGLRVSVGPERE